MSENRNNTSPAERPGAMGHRGGPGGSIGRPVEKAKDFMGTLKRLVKYLKPHTFRLAAVVLFALLSTAFTVLAPRISGDAINQLTDGFIAKHMISEVTKAQESMSKPLKARLDQIDSARSQAENQAKAAARAALEQEGASQDQIAAAEQRAAAAADKAFDDKISQSVTPQALSAMREMVSLPRISDIAGADEKADTVSRFASLAKKLPQSDSSVQSFQLSDEDLQKYLGDIRETNGVIPFDAIAKTLLFLLFVYLLSSLFTFLMRYIMASVSQVTVYSLRKDLNDKLARLPLKYYDGHTSGDILSRMTNDIDTVSSTLQQSMTQLIQSVCQILGYIIMMLLYSPILTLIVLCTLPLYIGVTMFIASHSQKYYKAQQKHLGTLSGHTEEMFTGHIIVKAFGRERESIETFEKVNDDLYNVGWKAQFMSGIMYPLMNFVSNIGYVLVSVVGGIFVTKSFLNIGDITAFIQYSRSFSMPIIQTANIANIIQSTIACAERVFEILDEEEEISDTEDAVKIEHPKGDIRFDHVKFRYTESVPLMEDMNLDFKQGETVAIVGPTGAGKTTLVNLLMRFYEVNGGAITFDGVDIRDIARGSLRTMFGMVLQDTWLFNGTIEENIAYGRENATHEQVVSAAKAAHADHFIRSLPEGYRTVLNEEASNISQGQKQLLTIARAILADPSVLILDEATSSVDTRTEVLIQKAMGVLMRGRTNFVIAHRLSTIRDAHLILVMNHGTIIETGSHDELMKKNGFYADLYNSQFVGANLE
ncbi:ABC transporter [Clostridium sp. W14A]|nr:ABC transporter [Clostridium sp. W14A]